MKNLITALALMLVLTLNAQNYNFSALNTNLISPTVDLTHGRSSVVMNEDNASAYFQYEFNIDGETTPDDYSDFSTIILGASYSEFNKDKSYTGHIGKIYKNWRGVIDVGYVDKLDGYSGTHTSFSFAYHSLEKGNNYLGLAVGNLHRVARTDGPDENYAYNTKMIVKLYGAYEVIDHVIVQGQISSRENDIAVKYKNERFEAGTYYSGNSNYGVFGGFNIGRFTIMGSVANKNNYNVGLKFL